MDEERSARTLPPSHVTAETLRADAAEKYNGKSAITL